MNTHDFAQLEADTATAEGLRLKAYRDSKGIWTIGFGTNLQELEIDAITAKIWLTQKLTQAAVEAQRLPWYLGLSGPRQRAVVELIYNMGFPRYMGFVRHQAAMAAGQFEVAADELLASKWRRDVGERRATRIAAQVRQG